jgi:peptidoglycan/xylan/chitin deacetylase (PgdA/CDA1 family)
MKRGVRGRRRLAGGVVLCYHAVSDRWSGDLAVRPERLAEQVESLLARGYRPATFTEATSGASDGPAFAVTFDDGFRSVLGLALPVLDRVGAPGTVFAVTDYADAPRPLGWTGVDRWLGTEHEHELACLSWSDLATLRDAGWEIGSHTRTHPRLTRLGDESLARELRESRERCEEMLRVPCRSIAYPYGDADERVLRAAAAAGYVAGAALERQPKGPAPLSWPRVGVWNDDGRWSFRAKVWRARRALLVSRTAREA